MPLDSLVRDSFSLVNPEDIVGVWTTLGSLRFWDVVKSECCQYLIFKTIRLNIRGLSDYFVGLDGYRYM